MKVFVIQPNYSVNSEVWLYRMNTMLENHICGMAAFLKGEIADANYPVFNLHDRHPTKLERWLIRLHIKKYDSQKKMREELYKIIITTGSDILIVHYANIADYLWTTLRRLTIPVYIYVHGFDIIWDHNDNEGKRLHPENYAESILSISKNENVKFITASNCSTQLLLSIGIERDRIYKKVFGVDLPVINRDYNKTALTILFLGRLVDYKGPDVVLNAFFIACDLGFKGQLVIAGNGPLKITCELMNKRSKYKDRVTFLGEVNKEQAAKLFEDADIYSMHNCIGPLSKGYDTFGVSIIEAMSYGLPIVTAGAGGPSEIIENEVNGLIVETDNIRAHAMAFMRLMQDTGLRSLLGNNARKTVLHKYHSSIEKKELFNILEINEVS